MVETVVKCDRCREVIPSGRTKLSPETGPWRESGRDAVDLCRECLGLLEEWLATPPTPSPSQPSQT